MTGIAYQYALAVFSLADDAGKSETFKDNMTIFAKSVDEEAMKFFTHPKIDKAQKHVVIEQAVEDKLLVDFLKVLVDNDRFLLLDAICMAYQEILDNIHKVMNVTIYSASSLSEKNLKKIESKLAKDYGRTIQSETIIDPAIVGGIRIEFEGNVIDQTINKQINDIKSSLLE